MTNSYLDLVQQTFNFPQEGFEVKDGYLQFNGVDVKALIDKYGTPLKLSYLPKIGMQIKKAKQMFAAADYVQHLIVSIQMFIVLMSCLVAHTLATVSIYEVEAALQVQTSTNAWL